MGVRDATQGIQPSLGSQASEGIQNSTASQQGKETQLELASHSMKETHQALASQYIKEAHSFVASHLIKETQTSLASQGYSENQDNGASQHDEVNQPERASSPPAPPNEPSGEGSGAGDDFAKQLAYLCVGGYYDHQKLRTAHMNRVRDLIRKVNEGIPFDKVEEKKEKKYDKKYKDENLPKLIDELEQKGKLTKDEISHLNKLLEIAKTEKKLEAQYREIISDWVEQVPLYNSFLRKIKGIGPVLGGGLLATFDIYKAKHISSFWKYAGLHTVDGKAPKKVKGQKVDFSIQARTLCWKVADSFIKARTPPYRGIYDRIKAEETARLKDTGKGWKLHAELRARRKMIKQFLADFYVTWARSVGKPLDKPYSARFHEGEERL